MNVLIGTALGALGLDIAVKLWAAGALGSGVIRLGGLVEFRQMHNTGMALGLFAHAEWAGLLLPVLAILCGWAMMRHYRSTRFTRVACGLVLGGFAGNYGQRLLCGYVLDMIYFPWLPWFVCNAADICICLGVALLAYSLLLRPQDWQEKAGGAKDATD